MSPFPKNTSAYDFNSSSLYENFIYIDYQQAIEIHKDLDEKDAKLIKNFQKKLNELKSLIDEHNIKPIFINQVFKRKKYCEVTDNQIQKYDCK